MRCYLRGHLHYMPRIRSSDHTRPEYSITWDILSSSNWSDIFHFLSSIKSLWHLRYSPFQFPSLFLMPGHFSSLSPVTSGDHHQRCEESWLPQLKQRLGLISSYRVSRWWMMKAELRLRGLRLFIWRFDTRSPEEGRSYIALYQWEQWAPPSLVSGPRFFWHQALATPEPGNTQAWGRLCSSPPYSSESRFKNIRNKNVYVHCSFI